MNDGKILPAEALPRSNHIPCIDIEPSLTFYIFRETPSGQRLCFHHFLTQLRSRISTERSLSASRSRNLSTASHPHTSSVPITATIASGTSIPRTASTLSHSVSKITSLTNCPEQPFQTRLCQPCLTSSLSEQPTIIIQISSALYFQSSTSITACRSCPLTIP